MQFLYGEDTLRLASNPVGRVPFNRDVFDRAVREVFSQGGFSADMLSNPAVRSLIEETYNTLNGAINTAIRTETPPELTAALQNNAFIFSGFKTYHSLSEVGLALTDADGHAKSFETFRKDVEAIDKKYNRNYLYAEYNHAIHTSQMAVKWHQFVADGDEYWLQYRTAGDERVRDAHAALDGTTLPPSDPFWNSYLPPNGWNCRCDVDQVLRSDYKMSDPETAMARGDACTEDTKSQIFRYNAGKEMSIFPKKHPYLPKGCGNCNRSLSLAYDPDSEKCRACIAISGLASQCERERQYKCYQNDSKFYDVDYDSVTGGLKATHVEHNFSEDIGYFGIPRGYYEKFARDALFQHGYAVELKSERGENRVKCPDGYVNNRLMDIKGIENGNPLYAMKRANNQGVSVAVLYFHDHPNYSRDEIERKFVELPEWIKATYHIDNPTITIDTVMCIVRQSDGSYKIDEIKKPGT